MNELKGTGVRGCDCSQDEACQFVRELNAFKREREELVKWLDVELKVYIIEPPIDSWNIGREEAFSEVRAKLKREVK